MNWEVTKEGNEIEITAKDMIVSTTDKKGTIIYANDIFCDIAGYKRSEVIGQPHNMIRHPKMPKSVFKLLWERVLNGEVIYAFVKNLAKNGDYYWVKAYVKPIIENGEVTKITSYRKPLNNFAKEYITKLYDVLLEHEESHSLDESYEFFLSYLKKRNLTYDQFIDRLSLEKNVENIALRNINYNKQKNSHRIFKEYAINCAKNKLFDEYEEKKHCVYEFLNWYNSLENEEFSNDDSWQEMKKHSSKFHGFLDDFVHSCKEKDSNLEKEELNELNSDIENIFNNLTIVRDRY